MYYNNEDINLMMNQIKDHRFLFEEDRETNNTKIISSGNDFYDNVKSQILDNVKTKIEFDSMTLNRKTGVFEWKGTLSNDIEWNFVSGMNTNSDGFYINTSYSIKLNDILLNDIKYLHVFLTGDFIPEINKMSKKQ